MRLRITPIPKETSSKPNKEHTFDINYFSEINNYVRDVCDKEKVENVSFVVEGVAERKVVLEALFG